MRRSIFHLATLAALFIGALVFNLRAAGSSPIAWFDTFNDEEQVQRCVTSDSCTATGVQTSVPGEVHAVGWLEFRTLLAWLGLGLDGTHLLLQILNALGVVLTFCLATRLGGPLAGAAAVSITTIGLGGAGIRYAALYNSVPLPFLGAVFVLACTAAVERPGVASLGFAALVGAVMANVHLACVLTGASVLWVALLAPRRRLSLTLFAGALFALATLVVAPPCWLTNITNVLHPQNHAGHVSVSGIKSTNLLNWGVLVIGVWLASSFSQTPAVVEYRQRCRGAVAVLVPFLTAFVVASLVGLDPNAKYLVHLRAPCAIAAALPLGVLATAALQPPSRRRLRLWLAQAAPIAVAALLLVLPPLGLTAEEDTTPTMADLTTVAGILHDADGWNLTNISERLKTPFGMVVQIGLRHLGAAADAPSTLADDSAAAAVLMVLRSDELPKPLPANWVIVRQSRWMAAVLIHTQSRIDWSTFVVCVRSAEDPSQSCTNTSWRLVTRDPHFELPGMPRPDAPSRATATLRLHLRRTVSSFTDEVFLPHIPGVCGGRIASGSEGALHVAADRRHATLSPTEASPSTIDLEWDILSPECDGMTYDGLPPFFVDADTADAHLLEAILRKRES